MKVEDYEHLRLFDEDGDEVEDIKIMFKNKIWYDKETVSSAVEKVNDFVAKGEEESLYTINKMTLRDWKDHESFGM